jgi:hypothetical protein
MPTTRDILRALRMAAMGLLVVSVLFGPAALGRSPALAAGWTSCGMACPCDDETAQQVSAEDGERDSAADRGVGPAAGSGDPCQDACPYACAKCGCGSAFDLAVAPLVLPSTALSWVSSAMLAPADAASTVAYAGIFRPPRFSP